MKDNQNKVVDSIVAQTDTDYRRLLVADVAEVLGTPAGRRFFSFIIGLSHWFDPPKVFGNRQDDIEIGRRTIGGELYTFVQQELGLKGLELIQLAQREFVAGQIERQTLIETRLKQKLEEGKP